MLVCLSAMCAISAVDDTTASNNDDDDDATVVLFANRCRRVLLTLEAERM